MGYQQRIWQRFAEQDGKGRAQRYRRLPPIIPLVIYHGRQEWSVPLALLDCIDADEELVALQRDFGYQVQHL
ncbi:MAG: Rpn family recombination-promoting nuclease/putative transposase, partial [Thiohalorhabdaceae bacterium]